MDGVQRALRCPFFPLEKVGKLVSANPSLLFERDSKGRTVLILACRHALKNERYRFNAEWFEHFSGLEALNATASDCNGKTALHYIAHTDHPEIARKLILSGADVNAQDSNDLTPLHYAAAKGWPRMIVYLIEAGADYNVQDSKGKTAVVYARGHCKEAHALLIEDLASCSVI